MLEQFLGGDRAGGVHHRPHQMLGHQPGQVGGGAQRAPVNFGEAEPGIIGGDHDVGVSG